MKSLINKILQEGIFLELNNGKLEIYTENPAIDEDLLKEIKENKESLTRFLIEREEAEQRDEAFSMIPVVEVQEDYSLSSAQRRIWLVNQFGDAAKAYNDIGGFILEGAVNEDKLEEVFKMLIERYEILRTVFKENELGEIRQYVLTSTAIGFRMYKEDLQDKADQEQLISEAIIKNAQTPFDLSGGPVLRVSLLKLAPQKQLLLFALNHIISDAWSIDILSKELFIIYNSLLTNTPVVLPELSIQYKDYAEWQQQMIKDDSLDSSKQYWIKKFENDIPVLENLGDLKRPPVKTFGGKFVEKMLDRKLAAQLRKFSQTEGVTLYMTLLATVKVLLYRYTSQEDIIIGSATAGRDHIALENQIGDFVNTIALRTQFKGVDTFIDVLQKVKTTTLEAYEHQAYPFDQLVDDLELKKDSSRSALFDVSVMLQNTNTANLNNYAGQALNGIKIHPIDMQEVAVSKFDLGFEFAEAEEDLYFKLMYNTDIFSDTWIGRLVDNLSQLFQNILADPKQIINEIALLTQAERQLLLQDFNDTQCPYPKDKTIVELFEQQVKTMPDQVAVVSNGSEITYSALNEKANQLGSYLKTNYQIQQDDLICIHLDPSSEMLIAMLGILKAGGAFVPVDPDYPEDRKAFIFEDSQCKLTIDEEEFESFNMMRSAYSKQDFTIALKPSSLGYVIYTSGSTGKPKGVMVEHSSLINLSFWHQKQFEVSAKDKVSKLAGAGFDASVWEIFPYLLNGATIFIVPPELRLNIHSLNQFFSDHNISVCFLPTPLYEQFASLDNDTLRILLTGGDRLQHFEKQSYRLINNYGPTENTVVATSFEVDKPYLDFPIGKPISNNKIYILDPQENLLPLGAVGELCIAGDSLSRGYLYNPELTAEKFVASPFEENEKMYKTGDLARWLPDGNIEFIGRNDAQVKIRGNRVELGEIESVIKEYEPIKQVAVVTKTTGDEKELVAYIVAEEEIQKESLQEFLFKKIPSYMVPPTIVQQEALPLTTNGKVDRKKLEALGIDHTQIHYVAPRNDIEVKLVEIWKEVLDREKIGVLDNFFDLGGHSLKATRLVTRIQQEFDIVVPLEDVFQKQNIEQIALDIEALKDLSAPKKRKSIQII